MLFSILTINTKSGSISHEDMNAMVQKCVGNILPIKYIDYGAFKSATESAPVPLYILGSKERNKDIETMDDVKDTFKSKGLAMNYTTPMSNSNPRYMVMDLHKLDHSKTGNNFAVRLEINEKLPVSKMTLMNAISQEISKEYIVTQFTVGKEANGNIECVIKYENGAPVSSAITREGTGIIGKYTKDNHMSINDILATMDNNIEVLMAPRDLDEFESMLTAHQSSLDYMQNDEDMRESTEYHSTKQEIANVTAEVAKVQKLIAKEPLVISSYIRVYDPTKLAKFILREIQFKDNKAEVWSK